MDRKAMYKLSYGLKHLSSVPGAQMVFIILQK